MIGLTDKYRPKTISDVVGQDRIVEQLKAYVREGGPPQSLLFSGPSGTGKTSTARAFARAINCLDPLSGDACLKCERCTATAATVSVNVVELDATNLNGVDAIRRLRDDARHYPVIWNWRIYILDEVHGLLSGQAQDALLKPLEEPGMDSRFILITTKPQKVNAPILSRVIHLVFDAVKQHDLEVHLNMVASAEGVEVEQGDIELIARLSGGSPREGLKQLQQLFIGHGPLESDDTSALATRLVGSALDGNVEALLAALPLTAHGRNTHALAGLFEEIAEDLLGLEHEPEASLLKLAAHRRAQLRTLRPASLNPLRDAAARLKDSEIDPDLAAGLCSGLLFSALSDLLPEDG